MIDLPRLLAAVDLPTLIQRSGGRLRVSGNQWRGRCPLHDGRNPSAFVVYEGADGRQRWHCHTDCDSGGDAISFLRRWHNLPDNGDGFRMAAAELAASINRPLADFSDEAEPPPAASNDLLVLAANYYAALLQSQAGQAARRYARSRGWQPSTLRDFLGYSDGRLRRYLTQQQQSLDAACELGLLRRRADGKLVDAIPAGYLIYRHHGVGGHICYLSGRSITHDKAATKARNLAARKALFFTNPSQSTDEPLVIVEGQADALSLYEWGVAAVALCGSSLRTEDIQRLRRYPHRYLALDGDAATRIECVAGQLGPRTLLLPAPPIGNDINGWHQAGGDRAAFEALVKAATPYIEHCLARVSRLPLWQRDEVLEELARQVSQLPPLVRAGYISRICAETELGGRKIFERAVAAYDTPTVPCDLTIHVGGIVQAGRQITNFVAEIVSDALDEVGQRQFMLRGRLADGSPLPEVTVSATQFQREPWWLAVWGRRAQVYLAPNERWQLALAIQRLSR